MHRPSVNFFIRLAVGISLVILLFFFVSPIEVFRSFQSINPLYLFGAVVVYSIAFFILAMRWRLILAHLGAEIPLSDAYQAFAGGVLYSDFTPGRIGDLTRAVLVKKWLDIPKATVSVIIDRYIDIIVITVLGISAVVVYSALISSSVYPLMSLIVLVIILTGTTFLFLKGSWVFSVIQKIPWFSLPEIAQSFNQALVEFRTGKKVIAQGIILTVFVWVLHALRIVLITLGMGYLIPLQDLFVILPLISALSLIPLTLSGLGLVEGGLMTVIAGYGVPISVAFSIAVLDRGITMLFHFIAGWKYAADNIL